MLHDTHKTCDANPDQGLQNKTFGRLGTIPNDGMKVNKSEAIFLYLNFSPF